MKLLESTRLRGGAGYAGHRASRYRPPRPAFRARRRSMTRSMTSGALLTSHRGWLARIDYNLDDRDGFNEPLLEKPLTVARTFRWRE